MLGTVGHQFLSKPSPPFPSESCIHLGTVFFLSSPVLSSYLPEQYFSVTFPGSFPNSITSTSIKPCWKNKELDKEIVKLLAWSQNLGTTHIYVRLVPSNIPTKCYAVIFPKCKCKYVPSLLTIPTEQPEVTKMKVRLLSFAQQGVCHQVCASHFPSILTAPNTLSTLTQAVLCHRCRGVYTTIPHYVHTLFWFENTSP